MNSRPPSIEGVVVEIDVFGFQVTFCAASTGLAGAEDDTAVAAGFFDSLGVALDDVLTEVGAGFAWLDSAAGKTDLSCVVGEVGRALREYHRRGGVIDHQYENRRGLQRTVTRHHH